VVPACSASILRSFDQSVASSIAGDTVAHADVGPGACLVVAANHDLVSHSRRPSRRGYGASAQGPGCRPPERGTCPRRAGLSRPASSAGRATAPVVQGRAAAGVRSTRASAHGRAHAAPSPAESPRGCVMLAVFERHHSTLISQHNSTKDDEICARGLRVSCTRQLLVGVGVTLCDGFAGECNF
jgi:hypothetical protein